MYWPVDKPDRARRMLRSTIELMVINPLEKFGVLIPAFQPHKTLGEEFKELSAFQITPFGRWQLETLNKAL
jgi:hypothetical protein